MITYLERQNLPNLAYIQTPNSDEGKNLPTIMFLGGFRSDMEGSKATYLEAKCLERGQTYMRFDYRGHGRSEGKFEEACISDWAQDAIDILDNCTSDKIMLIGSSMGGWVSLLAAIKRPEHIHSIIGLAAAPDFTIWMEEGMNDDQRNAIKNEGYFELPNDYDDQPYIITRKLIEDGRNNFLLNDNIDIQAPVRLIQGKKDTDVPWQTAERIKDKITGSDVEVLLIDDADHRLSNPEQLDFINKTAETLL